MGIGGNSGQHAVASESKEARITFSSAMPEMAKFPRSKVERELLSRLAEAGEEFAGTYEVRVDDVRDDAAPGFTWKPYSPKSRGWGFCHGKYIEDGITFSGRQYVLYPPEGVSLAELVELLTTSRGNVIPWVGKRKSPSKRAPVDFHNPESYRKFMAAMADAMASAGTNTPNYKTFNDVAMRVFGLSSQPAAGKWVKHLLDGGLLMPVPDLPYYLRCYGFGPEAGKYLPPERKGLAGTSLVSRPLVKSGVSVAVSAPSESTLSSNELASLLLRLDEVETLEVQAKADAAKIADLTAKVQTLTAKLANFDTAVEQAVQAKLATMLRAKLK